MLLALEHRTNSYVQFITVILLFLFVVLITFVTLKVISRIQKGQSYGSNIEVIESRAVANGKFLQIVRAGDKYILIAVGKDEISMLTELDADSLMLASDTEKKDTGFASVFDRIKNMNK